jgi:hypothetical protein
VKEKTQPEESIERYSTVSLSAGKRSRRKRSKRPAFRIIFIIEKRDGYPSVQSHAGRRCQHWQNQLPHPTHLPNCRTQPPPHPNSRLLRAQTHQPKCLAPALGLAWRPQAPLSSGKFLESLSGSADLRRRHKHPHPRLCGHNGLRYEWVTQRSDATLRCRCTSSKPSSS